ncbi:ATP-binding protein [Fusobacterium pseudoperiodonticum]|uniref:ATP-binding protein n=1 Tax=Fusobacterium pseudoperiodonticum TaxID=2663009 RepID=UPI000C1B901E|nr:ATP-binding protein [Fusobacterium pseudoperiodonticum]ATV68526.1 ATPase [Fusobacterium pseudoperiodonticum]
MDYIIREKYISKIKPFINKPVLKILTGMRRVGKSSLLHIIKDEILKDVADENKIYINFETTNLLSIININSLLEYLKTLLEDVKGKVYFFFDEIQVIDGWEEVISDLKLNRDCDIFLTSSNKKLISSLSEKYVEFEIQPFTFSEFKKAFENMELSKENLFYKFIQLGGLPFLKYFDLDETPSFEYLNDIYNTVLVKDVLQYNNIRDVDLFNHIFSYVLTNIGQSFSASSIKTYLKNKNKNISVDTILNYLEYCNIAFLIKKVPRYDILSKKTLKVDEKYYLTDHGFRQATGFPITQNIERILENIVYIELLSRGYEVKVGKVKDKEINFIAKKEKSLSYYQISYKIRDEKTRERIFETYNSITDNFPKYVLSMDHSNFSQDGVIHKNIIDFLSEDEGVK